MAEEIKFFGFGPSEKRTTIDSLNRSELSKYSIHLPATSIFTQEEVKALEPSFFPWPVVIRIPNGQDSSVNPTLVKTWDDLQNFLDAVRDPNSIINFNLPPQAAQYLPYRYVYAYVSPTYIYIHNVSKDVGVIMNMDNQKLFTKLSVKDSVIRLVRGEVGWFVDSIFNSNDPRLDPISSITLDSLEDHWDNFISGYRAGFFGTNYHLNLPRYIGPKSPIGDPYTFGFRVGCRLRSDISNSFSDMTKLDKQALIVMKLSLSPAEFDARINLVNLHNKIQSGDKEGISGQLRNYLNTECSFSVPDTQYICGQQGNYCPSCTSTAYVGKSISNHMDNAVKFLEEANACVGEYTTEKISVPDCASTIKNNFIWNSDNSQFRVITMTTHEASVRFQSKKTELLHDVEFDGDVIKTIAFKEMGSLELDIRLTADKFGMNEEDFSALLNRFNGLVFDQVSNFSGSSAKYCPLTFKSGIGFCLEDGTVLIPQATFFKNLKSQKGNLFNLYNGV